MESEQTQFDVATNLIFKNLVQDLKPYVGVGLLRHKIVNNAVYDIAGSNFVDESRFRTSYSLFFRSGVTYTGESVSCRKARTWFINCAL